MSLTGYLIWVVTMAVLTIVMLTVGTLAAAGIIGGSSDDETEEPAEDEEDAPEQLRPAA